MNRDTGSFINFLTIFLDRAGTWFLMNEALAHFVCAGTIENCKRINVGIIEISPELLLDRMQSFGISPTKIDNDCYVFIRDGFEVEIDLYSKSRKNFYVNRFLNKTIEGNWIKANEEDIQTIRTKRPDLSGNGLWRRQISEEFPYQLQLPFLYGTILDRNSPLWFVNTPHREYPTTGDIFFDEKRKENGYKLISGLYESAELSSIQNSIFFGFGTMLGYLMYGDFIAKDRDIDTCILTDGLSNEQLNKYVENIHRIDNVKPYRWEYSKRKDVDRYLWVSVGYKDPTTESGAKSCNWFFYSWNNFWWHSKGGLWVNPRKMNKSKVQFSNSDEAIALGQPKSSITGLTEVPFGNIRIKIPDNPGTCADHWYPGWNPRGEGASAHQVICVVEKWSDERTWRLVI